MIRFGERDQIVRRARAEERLERGLKSSEQGTRSVPRTMLPCSVERWTARIRSPRSVARSSSSARRTRGSEARARRARRRGSGARERAARGDDCDRRRQGVDRPTPAGRRSGCRPACGPRRCGRRARACARRPRGSGGDRSRERLRRRASAAREAALRERESASAARESELDAREHAVAERERVPADPDAVRLAQIERRLDELRAAEEAFSVPAATSPSTATRSRRASSCSPSASVSSTSGRTAGAGPEFRDLESRLRRLETQRLTGDQTRSFSGGFKKLEQEGTCKPQG